MSDTTRLPRLGLLVSVGATSASLMATEIALTRVLSVAVWYHFAFFAISLALLGTGLGALCVHSLQRRATDFGIERVCALASLVQAAGTLAVALVLSRVTPDWFGGLSGAFTLFTGRLLVVFAVTLIPFCAGGAVLASAMLGHAQRAERVYFADLLGAGIGCVATIPLLAWLGGVHALAACGLFGCISALLWTLPVRGVPSAAIPTRHTSTTRTKGLRATAVGLGLLHVLVLGSPWLELRVAKGIDLSRVRPELTRWNSFSLVSVFGNTGFRGWGLSPRFAGVIPEQKTLVIDMSALTTLTRFDGDLSQVAHLRYDLGALVYEVKPEPTRVCVIGAGGGRDVLTALSASAQRVTAIEINPLIVDDVMRGAYRKFTGNLYGRPDVEVVIDDGRSALERSQRRHDVIVISMVDTSAATAAGAYALTENGLYTVEAFEGFFAHLERGGVLAISTASLPELWVGARLAAVAREALRRGGHEVADAVLVAHTPWIGSADATLYGLLIKPDGFTQAERTSYATALGRLAFAPTYVPGRALPAPVAEDALVQRILTATDDAALESTLSKQALDVRAVHDDKPFFFYQNRFRDVLSALFAGSSSHLFGNGLRVLAKVLALSLLALLACMVVPLAWWQRSQLAQRERLAADLLYTACLGVAFMCVEIALVHRVMLYLGQPTYTLVAILGVLLVLGGVGSRVFGARLAERPARGRAWLVACAVAAAIMPWLCDWLFSMTHGASLPVRTLLVSCMLAPLGLALGAPFAGGLRHVAGRDPTRVPWLFGVNATASVLGSIAATVCVLHFGIHAAFILGAILYLLASLWWSVAARAARMHA